MMCSFMFVIFFKQKTAYEMRISDWSSDVCSSDLEAAAVRREAQFLRPFVALRQLVEIDIGPTERRAEVGGIVGAERLELLAIAGRRSQRRGAEIIVEIGREHVGTPVTNAHLVCSLLLEKTKKEIQQNT